MCASIDLESTKAVCWNLECLAILLVFILLLLLLVMIRPWGSLTLINLWFHRWRVFFWFSRNKNSFPVYDILSRAELTDGDLVAGTLELRPEEYYNVTIGLNKNKGYVRSRRGIYNK